MLLTIEYDHIEPFSYGYNQRLENFVASCKLCNQWKSNKIFNSVEEIQDYLQSKWSALNDMPRVPRRVYRRKNRQEILQPEMPEQKLGEVKQNREKTVNEDIEEYWNKPGPGEYERLIDRAMALRVGTVLAG